MYSTHFVEIFGTQIPYTEFLAFFFMMCAFIKSAQFGAHIWLPDSMEAPVPASALIHSATLVSAGIFLLLRLNSLFELAVTIKSVIAVVGAITAFYGGFVSMFQSDLKRILAYSTISHCGFLMVTFVTGVYEVTVLYLYVHGFFKAATFLCAGNIIRFARNAQDFRKMGGFYKYLPFECFACFVCLVNLSGLPFTIGFYIKHFLLFSLASNYLGYIVVLTFSLMGALTGIFYSYRFFFHVFFDFKKASRVIYYQAQRSALNSKYYSNTSLASNISILGLFVISYLVSIVLFQNLIYSQASNSEFFNNTSSILLESVYLNNYNILYNYSFFGWLVTSLIIAVIFSS